jgi:ABC-type branched-subunit amino acid transport system ATPase component/ABC-type branched-subunit amino acid transport system permease subunit
LPRGLPIGIVALGLVFGSLNALVAIGLVLVYRANRVVNFAQAELGAVAAVLAIELKLQWHASWFVAVGVALALGAGMGAAIEAGIMRRFRRAPRLLVAVATIGLAQVLSGLAVLIPAWLPRVRNFESFRVPLRMRFEIFPVVFDADGVVAVLCVPIALGALALVLARTDYGVAMRAAPDNPERARLLGIPVAKLSTMVWAIAGALSALAIVVRMPVLKFFSFDTVSGGGPSLLLRTLAAAVIGGMESLPVTAVAAVALGVFGELVAWSSSNTAVVNALLVLVILVALFARSRALPARVAREARDAWRAVRPVRPIAPEIRSLPEVRAGRAIVGIAVAAVAFLLPLWAHPVHEEAAALVCIYALLGVSLVVLTGWAGQISLGHFALAGLGAAATSVLVGRHGWDLIPALAAGIALSAAVAVLIGLPALRVRGPFLAVTTLGFAVSAYSFLFDDHYLPWFVQRTLERPVLLGRLSIEADWQMYYFTLTFLLAGIVMARNLRRARSGRALQALRDNDAATMAAGIDVTRMRLAAFALSGGLAGLAGALYVIHQHGFHTDSFSPDVSITVFSMAVIGGLGSIPGAVLGAVYVRGVAYFLHGGWTLIATGAGLLLLLLFVPGGLGEILFRVRDALLRAVARRRGIAVPSLLGRGAPALVRASAISNNGHAAQEADAILRCRGIEVSYDGVPVLFGVDLDVGRGEIVALLGPNGSGKSTLLNAISGLVHAHGSVELDGQDVTGSGAVSMAARGVAQVPGGRGVFPSLSVGENLRAAGWLCRRRADERRRAVDAAVARFPVLRELWDRRAGNLSGGEQQMLSLAQALIAKPRLLLIDELSLGLAPAIVDGLLDTVRELQASGTTVVLVEQSVGTALRVAERAVFLEKGRAVFAGPTRELLARPDLVRAVYLPRVADTRTRRRAAADAALQTWNLTRRYGGITAVDRVDLVLGEGETLGIIGPNGAGKTTLLDLISGFVPADAGRIRLHDADVTRWAPHMRALAGLGRAFQDARLWPSLTVRDAIAVAVERHIEIRSLFPDLFTIPAVLRSELGVARRVDDAIELMGLGDFANAFVSELSTGTRRIVELAAIVAQRPSVLLLDEPSSGLAEKETEALGPLLRSVQRETGCSMIVIEHHVPLVAGLADRLIAMETGRVIASGTPARVLANREVARSYLGEHAEEPRPRRRAKVAG